MLRSVMLKIMPPCGHGTGGRPDGGRDLQKSMEIIRQEEMRKDAQDLGWGWGGLGGEG